MTKSFSVKLSRKFLDLNKIADSGQAFRWRKLESGEGYFVPVCGATACFKQDDQNVSVEYDGHTEYFWRTYLDLERDYDVLCKRFQTLDSPLVSQALEVASGVRLLKQPFFESAIAAITSQNNNVHNISRCIEKMCGGASNPFPTPDVLLTKLSTDDCSLGYRKPYIQSFCHKYINGEFSDLEELSPLGKSIVSGLSDVDRPTFEIVSTKLMKEPGIGPKVAALLCLFALGYDNAVPRDVWIKRAEQYGVIWDWQYAGIEQQFVFYAMTHGLLERSIQS